MKRALLIGLSVVTLTTSCGEISLEGDAARPWACIPTPADAGMFDAGKQCSNGWSCGFDQKCFQRDGGQAAETWRCVQPEQCPLDWKCGVEVSGERFCQQIDAGAPSPCNVTADCEGGWRCGRDDKKCFFPVVTDVDAGRARSCTADGGDECPLGFRCGQTVGGVAHCLWLDGGTDAPCVSDDGCAGGWRCNLQSSLCVSVTDVVVPGSSETFGGSLISPKSTLPAPRLASVTRLVRLPWELLDLEPRPNSGDHPGVIFAGLHDGGVWVHAQALDRNRFPDGGRQDTVRSRFFAVAPGRNVVELVVGDTGVLVRYADFNVERFGWDGGVRTYGTADAIRGVDLGDRLTERRLLMLQPKVVAVLDQTGSPLPQLPNQPDAAVSLPVEVFVTGLDDQSVRVYAWTRDGVVYAFPLEDGGTLDWEPRAKGLEFSRSITASGAWLDMQRPSAILQVVGADGGQHLAPYLPAGIQDFLQADQTQTFPACPASTALLQMSYARVNGNDGAAVRCRSNDGGVITAFSRFNFTGLPPTPMNPTFQQNFEQLNDDLEPYLGPVTNVVGVSTVRAHASANGRYWFNFELDAGAIPGTLPLRPLVLDRAPNSIVHVPTLGLGLVSSASGLQYDLDDELGFTSSFNSSAFVVLDSFRNEPNWIITNGGAIDLTQVSAGGQPRGFLLLRPGQAPLQSPVSAFTAELTLNDSLRRVVLLTSGDALWASDVHEAVTNPFGAQAYLDPVFVPMPGVRLRSMTLVPTDGGVGGFLTTNINTIEFATEDLVQFKTSVVAAPLAAALPLEVWTEANRGRVGTRNGTIWSLPIMVPLTSALTSSTGGALAVDDYARRCGRVFATTREGLFALQPVDGGLPVWNAVTAVNSQLDSLASLRLYETSSQGDRLFVATPRGQVVEIIGSACP